MSRAEGVPMPHPAEATTPSRFSSLLRRLASILPGFTPAGLERLFDVFPDPLRASVVAILRRAGAIPPGPDSI